MKNHSLLLLICCLLLSSCHSAHAVQQIQKNPDEIKIPPLVSRENCEKGYASFSKELLINSRKAGENTLVSPLSVMLALAMTANGSQGTTLTEFENLFGMDRDALNAYCAQALDTYRNLGGSTESNLVNSLWCDPDLHLNEEFIARCQQNYAAELYFADLADNATVNAVNKWVKKATAGLIPKIVERFPANAVLALVNAVYLKNKFMFPFETPTSEWKMDFTAEDGTVSKPLGMSNGAKDEIYLENAAGKGVLLPYDDGRLGFLLLLPHEGLSLSDYLADWDAETIATLLKEKQECKVYLTVPKFELEWSANLNDILAEMGLQEAFTAKADFSALGESAAGPLYIGDVVHKTVLKVNEKGTEAAAVTVVSMLESVMDPRDAVTLRFDRPFVCGIIDMETAAPLFFGTVEKLN